MGLKHILKYFTEEGSRYMLKCFAKQRPLDCPTNAAQYAKNLLNYR